MKEMQWHSHLQLNVDFIHDPSQVKYIKQMGKKNCQNRIDKKYNAWAYIGYI